MTPDQPTRRIVTVIVNTRTPEQVEVALASVAAERELLGPGWDLRAIVADNDSRDGSVERLERFAAERGWDGWIRIHPLEENRGFGAGNNAGVREAIRADGLPELLLLLNPDAWLLPGAVRAMASRMDRDLKLAIVGPRIEYPDGTPQISCFRFPSWPGELEEGLRWGAATRWLARRVVPMPVASSFAEADWVVGACCLVRADAYLEVGGFDEDFFVYYEETDLCRRLRSLGWKVGYEPAARAVHLRGRTTGVTREDRRPGRAPAFAFESRRLYFEKAYGRAYARLAAAAFCLGRLTWELRARLQRKPRRDPPWFLWDSFRHLLFPGTCRALALLREDWVAHGRDWSRPGLHALLVYRFGRWKQGIRRRWLRAPLSVAHRALFRFVRNFYRIELPASARVGRRVVIEHQGNIVVHGNAVIGDGCVLRQGVTLGARREEEALLAPTLGPRVSVGAGAQILGPVRVGADARIGANAVVLEDVPRGCTAVGVPARLVPPGPPVGG